MRAYFVEVFVNERPVIKTTLKASNEATASARAIRLAREQGSVRRTDDLFVTRARKLNVPKPDQPE